MSYPYYKKSRLKQLRAFCQTAATGSVSKAAERLFLSQPSVSLQIKALEEDLQIQLFERHGPSIELTREGKVLYELAIPLVEGIDTLEETFAMRLGHLDRGELNIAAGESTTLYLLPEYMKRFTTNYPNIRFRLHNVSGRDGVAMLRANEIDFAVGSLIDVPEDINYQPIFYFDSVLITPPNHPLLRKTDLSLADISDYGLILPPRHLSTWRWQIMKTVFSQHDLEFKVTLEAGGWEIIKKYVGMNMGISIVTSICLTGQEALGVVPLNRYFPQRSYGVVSRHGKVLSAAARQFIELMDSSFFKNA